MTLGMLCGGIWAGMSNAHSPRLASASETLSVEQAERRLLHQLQQARGESAAPLTAHPALEQLAGEHSLALARRSELRSSSDEIAALEQRLWRLGYRPHYWQQAILAGHLDGAAIDKTRFQADLLRSDLEHAAISCVPWLESRSASEQGLRADPRSQILCLIIVAERQIRYQLRVAEPLRDLDAVRRAVLAEVNRIRAQRRLVPLEADEWADLAAQRHAEDMLRRDFYSHRNPEGEGARARATSAGLVTRRVAENIAKVVTTPEDTVARWMASSGHRHNLLLRRARRHGLGVAVGIEDGDVVAYWCQLIAD